MTSSDLLRCDLLGSKSLVETCKMKILEVLAKVNIAVPVPSSPGMKRLGEMRKRELEQELQPGLALLPWSVLNSRAMSVAFPASGEVWRQILHVVDEE